MKSSIEKFLSSESAGGLLLIFAAVMALLCANLPIKSIYNQLIDLPLIVQVGNFGISKPLLLWVNDGLMAIFFLLIGLELKREIMEGELSSVKSITLPLIGALGGMAAPALIYYWFNRGDPVALQGWAIPAATDIAFALGILSLLGNRVPIAVKVFLTSLAIFDDIGAIIIIAVFYTSKISTLSLVIGAFCALILGIINRCGVSERTPYLLVGIVMWVAFLKSGVHATLAGILLAFFIPMNSKDGSSPLKSFEHDLHHTVAFFILPVFAFCNSGIDLSDMTLDHFTHPVTLGITFGLFFGNQFGIFSLCYMAIKLKLATLPKDTTWLQLYGTSMLCGVGFTMSLFIGSLAFEETGVNLLFDERVGIFLGSLLSGGIGYAILKYALVRDAKLSTGGPSTQNS